MTGGAGRRGRVLRTEHSELFATAVVMEFAEDADAVRIVSCGHPQPLLLRDGKAVEIDVEPAAPLGVGLLGLSPPRECRVPLKRGDRLLPVSDGVTETRDPAGAFYPLVDRLTAFAGAAPEAPVDLVWADLVRFGTTIRHDVTIPLLTSRPEDDGD